MTALGYKVSRAYSTWLKALQRCAMLTSDTPVRIKKVLTSKAALAGPQMTEYTPKVGLRRAALETSPVEALGECPWRLHA